MLSLRGTWRCPRVYGVMGSGAQPVWELIPVLPPRHKPGDGSFIKNPSRAGAGAAPPPPAEGAEGPRLPRRLPSPVPGPPSPRGSALGQPRSEGRLKSKPGRGGYRQISPRGLWGVLM